MRQIQSAYLPTRLGKLFAVLSIFLSTYLAGIPLSNDLGFNVGPTLVSAAEVVPGGTLGGQNDSSIWRRLRQGEAFVISDPNTGSPVIVQTEGEEWRALRNGPLSRYGGYMILAGLVLITLFFLIRGRVKIDGGRSGNIVPRFTTAERTTHWFMASLFILQAVSGLIIFYGKYLLIPLIGADAFSAMASGALQGHNLFGPLYMFGILVMLVLYFPDNLLRSADLKWLLRGGMFFSGHAPSWKYNFGEKSWFWIAMITGVILSVSGIVMNFPSLAEDRYQLQLANLFHGGAAVVLIAAAIGHIYLGTIGVEGALEGMTRGEVDENWAREHHDLWAEEVLGAASDAPSSDQAPDTPKPAE
jgi:formate dehydrogenase subunit gamma